MRWVLVLFILIAPITMSFIFFKPKPRTHVVIADEISNKVARILEKRHGMKWVGDTAGMMGSVYLIGLMFQMHHSMDRNEARCRLVDCVEELINAVNENTEIRPFLKNYPFTTCNVDITIFIDNNGNRVFDPDIMALSLHESDYITYYTKEPNKIPYKSKTYESYKEALAFVTDSTQCNQVNQREAIRDSANKASFSRNTCE